MEIILKRFRSFSVGTSWNKNINIYCSTGTFDDDTIQVFAGNVLEAMQVQHIQVELWCIFSTTASKQAAGISTLFFDQQT